MSRAPRVDLGDLVYHIINRANNRQTIFKTTKDYEHFESLLKEAVGQFDMRLLGYVLMPNHWHLILHPKQDGDLSTFMQWLTLTHTQQHHARTNTIGHGHIYQGRYKSFLVEKDNYLLTLIKYVERNAVRAKLSRTVEAWRWGSGYRRLAGTSEARKLLSAPPIELPRNYRVWVNESDDVEQLTALRTSVNKGTPFGTMKWMQRMVERFKLQMTTRAGGRPRKK